MPTTDDTVCLYFYQIFKKLRNHRNMTLHETARAIRYDTGVIRVNELQTCNPSLKTLAKYIIGLDMEMYMNENGLTITDAKTHEVIIDSWPLENIK